jgi:hypothetical protein
MEYRACTQHYAALVILNRGSARRQKPLELTEAARLNCETVRTRLADHERELHGLTAETATSSQPGQHLDAALASFLGEKLRIGSNVTPFSRVTRLNP